MHGIPIFTCIWNLDLSLILKNSLNFVWYENYKLDFSQITLVWWKMLIFLAMIWECSLRITFTNAKSTAFGIHIANSTHIDQVQRNVGQKLRMREKRLQVETCFILGLEIAHQTVRISCHYFVYDFVRFRSEFKQNILVICIVTPL